MASFIFSVTICWADCEKPEFIETKLQYKEPLAWFDTAEHFCNNWLALPIHPFLTPLEVERIVETVNRVVTKCSYSA